MKKFYVGTTNDVIKRYNQHLNGDGSEWTKLYHPVKLLKSFESTSEFDEDNTTKTFMKIYGIDNVRGGTYCQIVLPEGVELFLQRELNQLSNACLECDEKGHFVKNCPNKCKPCLMINVDWKGKNSYYRDQKRTFDDFSEIKPLFDEYKRNVCENPNCLNCDHLAQRFYYLQMKHAYEESQKTDTRQVQVLYQGLDLKMYLLNQSKTLPSNVECKFCKEMHEEYTCPIVLYKRFLSHYINEEEICIYCNNDKHCMNHCPKYNYDLCKNSHSMDFIGTKLLHFKYVKTLKNKKADLENIRDELIEFRKTPPGCYLDDKRNLDSLKRYNDLLNEITNNINS